MGAEKGHVPVKLVLGVLYSEISEYPRMLELMKAEYGNTDYLSPVIPFTFTDYYNDEMGGTIYRQFAAFEKLITPEELADIKRYTNRIELEFAREGKRLVNFDPGYLELGKFLLATTKDQQHRIYIRDCIYEEITLYFQGGDWMPYPWTYPDYASREYRDIMHDIRKIYKMQIAKAI